MLELKILKLLMQCLMLAHFAHVVLLFDDACATRDARGVVGAAFVAADVKFIDNSVTFWAVALRLGLVTRRVSRENVDCKELIRLTFRLGNRIKPLKFDQCSAALSEAAIEERGNCN